PESGECSVGGHASSRGSLWRGGDLAMAEENLDRLTGSRYSPIADCEQITIAPDYGPPESQPAWRQDFPIDWPQDIYVERREFMKFMVLTSAAFTISQFLIAAQNWYRRRTDRPVARRLASLDDIAVGTAIGFTYP